MMKILEEQPDDSTYDQLLRELAFQKMIQRGLDDSDKGRTISHDEVRRRIESWLD